jgi:hypothetical protein
METTGSRREVVITVIPDEARSKRPVDLHFTSRKEVRDHIAACMQDIDMLPEDGEPEWEYPAVARHDHGAPRALTDAGRAAVLAGLDTAGLHWLIGHAHGYCPEAVESAMVLCQAHGGDAGPADCDACSASRPASEPFDQCAVLNATQVAYCELDNGHPGQHHMVRADGSEVNWPAVPFPAAEAACPSRKDGEACTVTGDHRVHYGADQGGDVRRMWHDGEDEDGGLPPQCRVRHWLRPDLRCGMTEGHQGRHWQGDTGWSEGTVSDWYCTGCRTHYDGEHDSHNCPVLPYESYEEFRERTSEEPPGPDETDDAQLARAVDALAATRPRLAVAR